MVPEKGEKEMKKVEITDEMMERTHKTGCTGCKINELKEGYSCCEVFADALKRERAERAKNPGVWDVAQKNADYCKIEYGRSLDSDLVETTGTMTYTRELPKTKAREISEERARVFCSGTKSINFQNALADIIEAAILEAQGKQS